MTAEYSTIIQKPNKLRIIAIITGIMIGLPLCTYLFFSATSFFARASDEIPRDVTISHINSTSAIIVWTTDKETLSVVEYGLDPVELSLYGPELEPKREHEVELNLLSPGTTYYFQIRHNDTVYDNAGVPWTFTTRTSDGSEVEQVRGVMTELTPLVTKKPDKNATISSELSTSKCDVTDCNEAEIMSKFGKGCSSADLIKCRNSGGTSGSTKVTPGAAYATPYPSPTTVFITSNLCKHTLLQAGTDCRTWIWDSMDTKPMACQDAFDRYIFQCKNRSFSNYDSQPDDWYFFGALPNIASNTAPLWKTPPNGTTVYCRLKAVDAEGSDQTDAHGTPWIYAEKKCEY